MLASPASPLIHQSTHEVKLGQTIRLEIDYSPFTSAEQYSSTPPRSLWVRVRNTEPIPLRAAYLAGPYSLYVDCRHRDYSTTTKAFVTADQPVFEPQLQPGQTFYAELLCHTFQEKYQWTVDVVSQIIFNNTMGVHFEVTIAEGKDMADYVVPEQNLNVTIHDTLDLWNLPLPDSSKSIHLVILTHGLHSNVSADMLFLKEEIQSGDENVVVKGYFGNICKTERGVKYLGSRVADYVVGLIKNKELSNVTKISFVGHSLGGLVQTFAIAYLESNYPWFFKKIQPVNFITLASPMLGIIHENPGYVKLALLAGIVGKTGQDLGLKFTEKDQKPLLLLLPSGPTHRILRRFIRRTVYANVYNDGIVPLRTSALLYLDYKALLKVFDASNLLTGSKDLQALDEVTFAGSNSDRTVNDSNNKSSDYSRAFEGNPFQTKVENPNVQGAMGSLPKTSMFESAASLILPPLPTIKYITDPESRENIILHDKVYHESDLPEVDDADNQEWSGKKLKLDKEDNKKKGMIELLQSKGEEFRQLVNGNTEHLEEEIAREYHKLMLWRKVLVNLKPDAHNNIVVRRRFANSYGWPVLDHLVKNHFCIDDKVVNELHREDTLDHSADAKELTRILSMDLIKKENAELDREGSEEKHEYAWINSQENGEIFVGPAGLLSDISDMVFNFKDQITSYGRTVENPKSEEDESDGKVMAEFI
ncbi:CIC11C00000004021 [Sungouiella intermedia]|uniref:CIC11C00000004021 n=1 Tax=Sungouiella intermedia TaxID=45354 RepID=A0A1L0BEB5_9ASCO|nr:CIC11C00000004021 [[Candida] intermedia]